MAFVITEKCVGTCDTACADVCPADCIRGPIELDQLRTIGREERGRAFPGLQLYIDPDACIDCSCCVPECPADAIFAADDVPAESLASIAANAAFFRR